MRPQIPVPLPAPLKPPINPTVPRFTLILEAVMPRGDGLRAAARKPPKAKGERRRKRR